jgi:hypothetical protein
MLLNYEDNIKMNLKLIGYKSVEWIHLAQDGDWWWTVVKTVMFHKSWEIS